MNTIPQRLNAMTHEQKARRIMELEDALQQTNDRIAAAVQAEREVNREPLEDATRQLKAIAAYANTLPKKYAAELSSKIRYGDIEAAAIRARSGNGSK